MKTVIYFMLTLSLCASCFAKENVQTSLPKAEVAAIEAFFKEFKEAFNDRDMEKIKKISGNNLDDWSRNIKRGVVIKRMEIIDILTSGVTNVITKATAVETNGKRSSPEIVFTLTRHDGTYSIEKIAVPEVEKRNHSLRDAVSMTKKLVTAINNKDLDCVKDALTIDDVSNFETELSARGLSWIKDAMTADSNVICEGVGWEGNGRLVGDVYVCSASGGTNVLQRFIFKDGKIDRAAPRKETKEEFMKRIKAENEKMRKEWEAQKAAEEKILEEKLLKQQRSKSR